MHFKPQFYPGQPVNRYGEQVEFEFREVRVSPCMHAENDSSSHKVTPMMCRLRDLSYEK